MLSVKFLRGGFISPLWHFPVLPSMVFSGLNGSSLMVSRFLWALSWRRHSHPQRLLVELTMPADTDGCHHSTPPASLVLPPTKRPPVQLFGPLARSVWSYMAPTAHQKQTQHHLVVSSCETPEARPSLPGEDANFMSSGKWMCFGITCSGMLHFIR